MQRGIHIHIPKKKHLYTHIISVQGQVWMAQFNFQLSILTRAWPSHPQTPCMLRSHRRSQLCWSSYSKPALRRLPPRMGDRIEKTDFSHLMNPWCSIGCKCTFSDEKVPAQIFSTCSYALRNSDISSSICFTGFCSSLNSAFIPGSTASTIRSASYGELAKYFPTYLTTQGSSVVISSGLGAYYDREALPMTLSIVKRNRPPSPQTCTLQAFQTILRWILFELR